MLHHIPGSSEPVSIYPPLFSYVVQSPFFIEAFEKRLESSSRDQAQQQRIALLHKLMKNPKPKRTPSDVELELIAKCFGELFFDVYEAFDTRYTIFVHRQGSGPYALRGSTSSSSYCYQHRQTYRVRIDIYLNNVDPDDPFIDAIHTLLHELVHGFIDVYLDRNGLSATESMIRIGMTGHGSLFEQLFRKAAAFLRNKKCWKINVSHALCNSVENEQKQREKAYKLWKRINVIYPGGPKTFLELTKVLDIIWHKESSRLRGFMEEGRDLFEIILLMFYNKEGLWKGDWREPRRVLAGQKSHELFVMALNEDNRPSEYVKQHGFWFNETPALSAKADSLVSCNLESGKVYERGSESSKSRDKGNHGTRYGSSTKSISGIKEQ